jgi:predicted GIY-YIG superfamily endonuclease
MLKCSNGHIYTGQTDNFERRWLQHQQGHASSKYTRSFPAKKILLCIQFECGLSDILKLEYSIKQLSTVKKLKLIENKNLLMELIQSLGIIIQQIDYA